MTDLDGSELLLNNLEILTQELDNLSRRLTNIEKDVYGIRRDTDANSFEIDCIQDACEQLASEIVKLEEKYYDDQNV
jgi:chromosome segregation ATPase